MFLFIRLFSVLLRYGKFALELVADNELELLLQRHCIAHFLWLVAGVIMSMLLLAN